MIICPEKDCTGCFACMNICPKNAISVGTDKMGKTIPRVDSAKCVDCRLCQKTCPANNPLVRCEPKNVYAAWSKNEQDIRLSSSGGAASVFSRKILQEGGVVFGAAVIDGMVSHIAIENEDGIEKLRSSKYVQSDIGYAYRKVKCDLLDGKPVLFTGTPCQIAGLRNFLGKKYENLYTVDLICHGTPPNSYLREHLASVLGKHKEWDRVTFRGEHNYILTVYRGNQIIYQKSNELDTYFRSFLNGLIFRENCYSCLYANEKRVGDITVADFWGIDRKKMEHPYDGRISLVLINTERGERLFDKVKDNMIWEKHTLAEAMSSEQTNLHHPSIPHKDRALFEAIYIKQGFETAVKKTEIGRNIRRTEIRKFIKDYLKV